VRDRIVRAFLIEEQKIVKKVLKETQEKKTAKK
jgi:large subunit ribosomal protein L34e